MFVDVTVGKSYSAKTISLYNDAIVMKSEIAFFAFKWRLLQEQNTFVVCKSIPGENTVSFETKTACIDPSLHAKQCNSPEDNSNVNSSERAIRPDRSELPEHLKGFQQVLNQDAISLTTNPVCRSNLLLASKYSFLLLEYFHGFRKMVPLLMWYIIPSFQFLPSHYLFLWWGRASLWYEVHF